MSVLLVLAAFLELPGPPANEPLATSWGTIRELDAEVGTLLAEVTQVPKDGRLSLPTELPDVVNAYVAGDAERTSLRIEVDERSDRCDLRLPEGFSARPAESRVVLFETAEKSGQLVDGHWVFSVGDARIFPTADAALVGELDQAPRALVESKSRNRHVRVTGAGPGWKFRAMRPGTYHVELTYACPKGTPRTVTIGIGELPGARPIEKGKPDAAGERGQPTSGLPASGDPRRVSHRVEGTGGWTSYTVILVGTVRITHPGDYLIGIETAGEEDATVRLKAIILRPAPEGKPVLQADDGTVTCHARDVTILGVQVQYEPKPEKNTVGYWTNPRDRIRWEFALQTPGRFAVEVLQGCGKDQGGSEVELSVADQSLRFVVEDTGHFQNFVTREIGVVEIASPGRHTLTVKPLKKAGVAVMDLRQVRLVPRRGE